MKFPKKIFVKIEKDSSNEYLIADESIDGMVNVGDKVKIALYELATVTTAEGLVKITPDKRR